MQKFEFLFDTFLIQRVEKEFKCLFIGFIIYLEELMEQGKITQEEFQVKRKQILDLGNGSIRSLSDQIESIFNNTRIN